MCSGAVYSSGGSVILDGGTITATGTTFAVRILSGTFTNNVRYSKRSHIHCRRQVLERQQRPRDYLCARREKYRREDADDPHCGWTIRLGADIDLSNFLWYSISFEDFWDWVEVSEGVWGKVHRNNSKITFDCPATR